MKFAPWIVGCALVLPACGGSDGDPPEVTASDVSIPSDVPGVVARMEALLKELAAPLAAGTELRQARPKADELAILADAVGGLAAKSYDKATAAKLDAKGKDIAKQGRNLAAALRKGDAAKAKVVHTAAKDVVTRLKNALPKPPKKEE